MQQFIYNMPTVKQITDRDIYRAGYCIPFGFELTGEFRVPQTGDMFLHSAQSHVVTARENYAADEPRLLVRPKPKVKVVTFRATGEKRLPKRSEWYSAAPDGMIWKASSDHYGREIYEIFTRTETEE